MVGDWVYKLEPWAMGGGRSFLLFGINGVVRIDGRERKERKGDVVIWTGVKI